MPYPIKRSQDHEFWLKEPIFNSFFDLHPWHHGQQGWCSKWWLKSHKRLDDWKQGIPNGQGALTLYLEVEICKCHACFYS